MAVEIEMLKGPAKGSVRKVADGRARALVKVGYARIAGGYQTRHLEAAPVTAAPVTAAPAPEAPAPEPDDLDGMSAAELRDVATDMGLSFHHRAGAERLRTLIRENR